MFGSSGLVSLVSTEAKNESPIRKLNELEILGNFTSFPSAVTD